MTTTDTDNIDRFNKHASEAFAILYASFPLGCSLCPEHFDVPQDGHGSVSDDDAEFVSSTIRWLQEEGYVRSQTSTFDGSFHGAVLTGKGLAVMKLIPDALSNPAPLGEQIQSAVKTGATVAAKSLLNAALDAGIKYTMTRAGLPT
ncbi:hypothetical protein [Burkholderia ambifaria]|uniref:hypothetical protein n=1 Tax=Burkholderia ambifaria TaxID=152480 RepID=UPI00278D5674|nr:hypothetical protein [Burkholderia contaminans]